MLPALKEHHAEFLLKELYKRWGNHKIMVRWLSRFFNYLDRCARAHTRIRGNPVLPSLRPHVSLWHSRYPGFASRYTGL